VSLVLVVIMFCSGFGFGFGSCVGSTCVVVSFVFVWWNVTLEFVLFCFLLFFSFLFFSC